MFLEHLFVFSFFLQLKKVRKKRKTGDSMTSGFSGGH